MTGATSLFLIMNFSSNFSIIYCLQKLSDFENMYILSKYLENLIFFNKFYMIEKYQTAGAVLLKFKRGENINICNAWLASIRITFAFKI